MTVHFVCLWVWLVWYGLVGFLVQGWTHRKSEKHKISFGTHTRKLTVRSEQCEQSDLAPSGVVHHSTHSAGGRLVKGVFMCLERTLRLCHQTPTLRKRYGRKL